MLYKTDTKASRKELGRALAECARRGDVELGCELLKQGARFEDCPETDFDNFFVNWAIKNEDVGLLRLLISAGADFDMPDSAGLRPLTLAITERVSDEVVKAMLDAGVETNYATQSGLTPLLRALEGKNIEVIRLLVEYGARPTYIPEGAPASMLSPLQQAVVRGRPEIVQLFASVSHEDLDQVTSDGRTLMDLSKGSWRMTTLIRSLQTDAAVGRAIGEADAAEPARTPRVTACSPM